MKKKTDKSESVALSLGDELIADLRRLIMDARKNVAHAINAELTLLYWNIGRRIREDILNKKRAAYGKESVAAVRRHLGWTHFKYLIPMDDPLKREFYAEMCRVEKWSTRMLNQKIQSMLYERTALSRKPEKLITQELKALREEDKLSPDLV